MKSINLESTKLPQTTRQSLVRLALLVGLGLVSLIVAIVIFYHVKSTSYARLAPLSVSLEISYLNDLHLDNEVVLEYNYGYGFIPAHRQSQTIHSGQAMSLVEFSISSWKSPTGIRLSIQREQGVVPHKVTLTRLAESSSVLLSSVDSGILWDTQDVPDFFSSRESLDTNTETPN